MLDRRELLKTAAAATLPAVMAGGATAQTAPASNAEYIKQAGKSLVYAGPGGGLGESFKRIFAEFTKDTGISVTYLTGPIMDMYGRIRAERNRPSIDVYLSNGVTEARGIADGAFLKLDPKIVTALPELYDIARVPNDMGVRIEFTNVGIIFNKKPFLEKNIPFPTKWDDVWSPAVNGRVILGDTTSFYTVLYIAYMNKLRGGREDDPSKGIDFIASQRSKMMAVVRTYPERMQMLTSGQAWLTVDVGLTSIPETKNNPDLGWAQLDEAPLFWNGFKVVNGCPNPIGAQVLVNYMISQKAQLMFAKENFVGPANKHVKLDDELAKIVPYGPEGIKRFVALDQGLIGESLNKYRDLWNAKFS
jgi:putative spermidine/putrescine transport system substrate-binding protein